MNREDGPPELDVLMILIWIYFGICAAIFAALCGGALLSFYLLATTFP